LRRTSLGVGASREQLDASLPLPATLSRGRARVLLNDRDGEVPPRRLESGVLIGQRAQPMLECVPPCRLGGPEDREAVRLVPQIPDRRRHELARAAGIEVACLAQTLHFRDGEFRLLGVRPCRVRLRRRDRAQLELAERLTLSDRDDHDELAPRLYLEPHLRRLAAAGIVVLAEQIAVGRLDAQEEVELAGALRPQVQRS